MKIIFHHIMITSYQKNYRADRHLNNHILVSSDDSNTVQIWGDSLENYSGRGPTNDCIIKPDIVAPGSNINSCRTPTPYIKSLEKDIVKNSNIYYMQLSGTSMSTPIVTGAIALLLQKNPRLTPDEVKLLMKKTSTNLNCPQNQQGWGLINIERLLSYV